MEMPDRRNKHNTGAAPRWDSEDDDGIDELEAERIDNLESHWDPQRRYFAQVDSSKQQQQQDMLCCEAWQQRSTLEKALLLSCAILLLSLLSVGLRDKQLEVLEENRASVCETEACIHAASDLLASIDASTNPCDDFYEHVCGNWVQSHPIEPTEASVSTLSKIADQNRLVLRQLLENDASTTNSSTMSSYMAKPRKFYRACMDLNRINIIGTVPVDRFASDLGLHAWTVDANSTWDAQAWDTLRGILTNMHRASVGAFFDFGIYAGVHNSSKNVVYLGQGGLALPSRSAYIGKNIDSDSSLVALRKLIVSQITAWRGEAHMNLQRARNIVLFEQELAGIMEPPEKLRDPTTSNTPVLVKDLDALMPNMKLSSYLYAVLQGADQSSIHALHTVTVESTTFLERMENLLASTSLETVRDYLLFRIIFHFSPHLPQKFLNNDAEFDKVVYGIEMQTPRWKLCVSRTESRLGFLVARMFLNSHFSQDSKAKASALVKRVQDSFKKNLGLLDWMDETTRARAREKVDASEFRIGYPDFIMDDVALNSRYDSLSISENDYFANLRNAATYDLTRVLKRLGNLVDKEEWHMNPVDVNAYYSNSNNELVFPAGILQPPLFHKDYIPALNYGCIASVIGHELSHGFDDVGAQYNSKGNLETWWQPATYNSFRKQTDCVRRQYDAFTVLNGKAHVRGNLTLGENIADHAGLKQAYTAYQSAREEQELNVIEGTDESFFLNLPGLSHYTSDQMFFIAFARTWCGNMRDQTMEKVVLNDVHSPSRFRVIGTLQSFQPFADAFQCPAGSTMNPTTRCEVW